MVDSDDALSNPKADVRVLKLEGPHRERWFARITGRSVPSIQRKIIKILKTSALEKVDTLRLQKNGGLLQVATCRAPDSLNCRTAGPRCKLPLQKSQPLT